MTAHRACARRGPTIGQTKAIGPVVARAATRVVAAVPVVEVSTVLAVVAPDRAELLLA